MALPTDKIPPYDNKISFVLKCTWRRRIMDQKIPMPQEIDTLFQKKGKRKKDNVMMKIIKNIMHIIINSVVYGINNRNVHNRFAISFRGINWL